MLKLTAPPAPPHPGRDATPVEWNIANKQCNSMIHNPMGSLSFGPDHAVWHASRERPPTGRPCRGWFLRKPSGRRRKRPSCPPSPEIPVASPTVVLSGSLRMHRVFDSVASAAASPYSGVDGVAFSVSGHDRHAKVMISELNGWPAFPLADATPAALPSPAYGSRPE